jgi:membrane associated rhomboid family serine protease
MSERCPVCGAELPDRTEAWLHLREVHADSAPPPTPASTPPPAAPPPNPAPPAEGIWRQGWRTSPATMSVIVVTFGVWIVHLGLQTFFHINTDTSLGGNGMLGTDGQWWRLVTPLVVHFGLLHITFNMLWTYQFGPPIERLMGRGGFLAAYVTTGVAGNVCSDAVYWHHQHFLSGGASGAVYGLGGVLIGTWAATKWLQKRDGRPSVLQFNDEAIRSIAIFFGAYLVIGPLLLPVDTAAHFGGGVFGLMIGAGVAWRHHAPRLQR